MEKNSILAKTADESLWLLTVSWCNPDVLHCGFSYLGVVTLGFDTIISFQHHINKHIHGKFKTNVINNC
jgi:hypothetical protein